MQRRPALLVAAVCAIAWAGLAWAAVLYSTDFTDDESASWSLTNATIDTIASGTPGVKCAGGWGAFGWGELTGTDEVDEVDVEIDATTVPFGSGNQNAYNELACRTSTSTDGANLRVWGRDDNAKLELRDGDGTVLDSMETSDNSGIRSQHADLTWTLTCDGTDITGRIQQAAGTCGAVTCTAQDHTLTGTATVATGSGNVRFSGTSYSTDNRMDTITVETLAAAAPRRVIVVQ